MKKIIMFVLSCFIFVGCNERPILTYQNDEFKIFYEFDPNYEIDKDNLNKSFSFLNDDEIELYKKNKNKTLLKQLEKENFVRSTINDLKNEIFTSSEYEVLEDRIKNLDYNETELKLEKLNQFLKEYKIQNETLSKLFVEFYQKNLSDNEIIKKLYESKELSLFLISPENIVKEKYKYFVEKQKVFDKIEPYIKEANKDLILPQEFYYYLLEKKYILPEEINVFQNNEIAKIELTKLYTDKTGNYINTIKEYRNYKELKEEEQRKKNDNDHDFILGAAIGATTSAVILNSIK